MCGLCRGRYCRIVCGTNGWAGGAEGGVNGWFYVSLIYCNELHRLWYIPHSLPPLPLCNYPHSLPLSFLSLLLSLSLILSPCIALRSTFFPMPYQSVICSSCLLSLSLCPSSHSFLSPSLSCIPLSLLSTLPFLINLSYVSRILAD